MSGMRTKLNTVLLETSQCMYDIFVFVETWLTPDFYDAEIFNSDLYNVFRRDRDLSNLGCSRGGGVIIAVDKKFNSSLISCYNNDPKLEQLCVLVTGINNKLILCASYIPPNSPMLVYNGHMENIEHAIAGFHSDIYVCVLGDFNLPNINWRCYSDDTFIRPFNMNSLEADFIDNLYNCGLFQINNVFNSFNRLLDLIFLSSNINFNLSKCSTPLSKNVLHHSALIIVIEFCVFLKLDCKNYYKFNFKLANFVNLTSALDNVDWICYFNNSDISKCYNIFLSKFLEICDLHIPVTVCKTYRVPWFTKDLLRLKNLRNKYHKRFKLLNNNSSRFMYLLHLHNFNVLNTRLYNNYMRKIESSIKFQPRNFWNYIKSLKATSNIPAVMHFSDRSANDAVGIANLFADFFSSNFNDHNSVPDDSFFTHINSLFDFGSLLLSIDDVMYGISMLSWSKAEDMDRLSPFLLRTCACSISNVILYLLNLSLVNGVFIDHWKITTITPLLKSGAKNCVQNYRPIAKLSTFAKLFEIIIKSKLSFCIKRVISPYQHGFVQGRSTTTNLAIFNKFCHDSFASGFQVDVIYTDLAKAFDRVSHGILLKKLSKLGFHSNMLRWFASYLKNRLCCVSIDGVLSQQFYAMSGVPQGSILGPILFILFFNDVSNCFVNVHHLIYADDLKIYYRIEDHQHHYLLQNELNKFVDWCDLNHLQLNVRKCVHMTLYRSRSFINTSYFIGGSVLDKVEEFNDLGVIFDYKLTFINHINTMLPKAYKVLSFVRRNCKNFVDPHTAVTLFNAFVRSRLEYASIIWNPYYAGHSSRIERIQRIFTRFAIKLTVFNDTYICYESRCLLLGLRSLESRRIVCSIMFIFDIINSHIDAPELLYNISFYVPSRALRNLKVFGVTITPRTKFAANEFFVRTMLVCNDVTLKFDLDFSTARSVFKNNISSLQL